MLQRAAMNEEIADGEISVQDIQQILLNEYSLKVINVSGQCSLGGVENAKPTMWNLQMYENCKCKLDTCTVEMS